MSASTHGLTGLLGRIADAAGVKAALALAEARGGREMALSSRPDGVLASIVGAQAALAIVQEIGVGKVTIPMAHLRGQRGRREAAARMLRAGAKISQVAEAVDVHERTVYRLKGNRDADTTGSLFGDD
ncbi:hypothetical protein D3C80_127140 [compost metagenome]